VKLWSNIMKRLVSAAENGWQTLRVLCTTQTCLSVNMLISGIRDLHQILWRKFNLYSHRPNIIPAIHESEIEIYSSSKTPQRTEKN
jgi:hypothetical protein